jgi:hypothetical protein
LVGRWSFRRRWAGYTLIALALAVAGAVGASVLGFLPWAIYETVLEIGGAAVVVGWLGLVLLSVWWGRAPAGRWESCVIVCLAAGMGGLIVLQSGACLWWRLVRPELWERRADARGGLQQATGWTCYPAAAVMLLHHYGIAAGEGEMAYSANTSLWGTDHHAMARALTAGIPGRLACPRRDHRLRGVCPPGRCFHCPGGAAQDRAACPLCPKGRPGIVAGHRSPRWRAEGAVPGRFRANVDREIDPFRPARRPVWSRAACQGKGRDAMIDKAHQLALLAGMALQLFFIYWPATALAVFGGVTAVTSLSRNPRKNWSGVAVASCIHLLVPAMILWCGVAFPADTDSDPVATTAPEWVSLLLPRLLLLHIPIAAVLVWRAKGARSFVLGLSAVFFGYSLCALLASGMSMTGDWL